MIKAWPWFGVLRIVRFIIPNAKIPISFETIAHQKHSLEFFCLLFYYVHFQIDRNFRILYLSIENES